MAPTADSHPRTRLDETIHAPVRLSIMAALAAADRVEFRYLRDLLEVSDSLLSKHMTTLETAGYVVRTPDPTDRRNKVVELTETGRHVLVACRRGINAMEARLLAGATAEDVAAFRRVLDVLAEGGAGLPQHPGRRRR